MLVPSLPSHLPSQLTPTDGHRHLCPAGPRTCGRDEGKMSVSPEGSSLQGPVLSVWTWL